MRITFTSLSLLFRFFLLLLCGGLAWAQSEILVTRFTDLSATAFSEELGRLRAEGFVSESSMTVAYQNAAQREVIKSVSGKVVYAMINWNLVANSSPGSLKNYKRSDATYMCYPNREYTILEWDPKTTPNPAPSGELTNLSTRAVVPNGGSLIPGFVIRDAPTRVLIRAVGEGLKPFGVQNFMVNPKLQVQSTGGVIAENDDWASSTANRDLIASANAAAGAFGLAEKDSAVVLTLNPGAYTATVSGAAGVGGDVLVEVYRLPTQ